MLYTKLSAVVRNRAMSLIDSMLLLGLVATVGCSEAPDDTAEVADSAGPLVISDADDQLRVEAPEGAFNMFGIYALYSTDSCGLVQQVYGVTGPEGVRIEDCPECVLPGAVEVGEEIPGFDSFACLPGAQACEVTEAISGLTFTDLTYEVPLCGEIVAPELFVIQYEHLDTTEPEAPRTFVVVSAAFRLTENGAVEIVSDWDRCVSDENGEECLASAE